MYQVAGDRVPFESRLLKADDGVAETGELPVCGVMALVLADTAVLGLVELEDEFELDAWWL